METIKSLIAEIKEVKFNSFNYCSFIISDLFEEIENQIIINTFSNNLSDDDKVEDDEIITNMDASSAGIGNEVANFEEDETITNMEVEEPVEYAYQWGTNEL